MKEIKNILDNFISYISVDRGLSKNTVLAYKTDILKFICFVKKKQINLEDCRHNDITDFLFEIKVKGLKPRSIFRTIESLRQFYKFLCLENLVENNPTVYLVSPKIPENLPNMLSLNEINILFNSMDTLDDIYHIRNRAMLELLYAAGLRVSELINLKFLNMNLENCFLRIIGKGAKERLIPFGNKAKYFINVYLLKRPLHTIEEEYVFISRLGKKLSRVEFWRQLKNIAKKAGIIKNITPHTLRHSFASHLLAGGANIRFVQEMLGHVSIASTQIYTHLDKSQVIQQHKRFHPKS
ncbi:MAG: site-specific tyrosine recombinase XerD [Endomicrobium sp.]|jgi:integrase/recombinase XerD|nr:site-specific tyrosine recombinase XerD [Endomicrobium sp.]